MAFVPYALTRPFLFGLDPEHAHELTLGSIAALPLSACGEWQSLQDSRLFL